GPASWRTPPAMPRWPRGCWRGETGSSGELDYTHRRRYSMGIPARLIEFLDQNKVGYEILHHPEAFTAQELAAIEHVKGKQHAKVVMVKSDGAQLMAVLPADHRVDLEKFEKLTGKSTALATEADFKALFPDCALGTMP